MGVISPAQAVRERVGENSFTLDELRKRRAEIERIAERHGARNVRGFGSVASGDSVPGEQRRLPRRLRSRSRGSRSERADSRSQACPRVSPEAGLPRRRVDFALAHVAGGGADGPGPYCRIMSSASRVLNRAHSCPAAPHASRSVAVSARVEARGQRQEREARERKPVVSVGEGQQQGVGPAAQAGVDDAELVVVEVVPAALARREPAGKAPSSAPRSPTSSTSGLPVTVTRLRSLTPASNSSRKPLRSASATFLTTAACAGPAPPGAGAG